MKLVNQKSFLFLAERAAINNFLYCIYFKSPILDDANVI